MYESAHDSVNSCSALLGPTLLRSWQQSRVWSLHVLKVGARLERAGPLPSEVSRHRIRSSSLGVVSDLGAPSALGVSDGEFVLGCRTLEVARSGPKLGHRKFAPDKGRSELGVGEPHALPFRGSDFRANICFLARELEPGKEVDCPRMVARGRAISVFGQSLWPNFDPVGGAPPVAPGTSARLGCSAPRPPIPPHPRGAGAPRPACGPRGSRARPPAPEPVGERRALARPVPRARARRGRAPRSSVSGAAARRRWPAWLPAASGRERARARTHPRRGGGLGGGAPLASRFAECRVSRREPSAPRFWWVLSGPQRRSNAPRIASLCCEVLGPRRSKRRRHERLCAGVCVSPWTFSSMRTTRTALAPRARRIR